MPPNKSDFIREYFIYDVNTHRSICQCEVEVKTVPEIEVFESDDTEWEDDPQSHPKKG